MCSLKKKSEFDSEFLLQGRGFTSSSTTGVPMWLWLNPDFKHDKCLQVWSYELCSACLWAYKIWPQEEDKRCFRGWWWSWRGCCGWWRTTAWILTSLADRSKKICNISGTRESKKFVFRCKWYAFTTVTELIWSNIYNNLVKYAVITNLLHRFTWNVIYAFIY